MIAEPLSGLAPWFGIALVRGSWFGIEALIVLALTYAAGLVLFAFMTLPVEFGASRRRGASRQTGLAAMASFFLAYALAGWRPWETLVDSGDLYLEATTMTMAGIVFAQVGAVMAWRTNRESLRTIGLLTNRLILVGIAVEIAMLALLASTPGLDEIVHTSDLSAAAWLFVLLWPPLVLGAEELRKAVLRRRRP